MQLHHLQKMNSGDEQCKSQRLEKKLRMKRQSPQNKQAQLMERRVQYVIYPSMKRLLTNKHSRFNKSVQNLEDGRPLKMYSSRTYRWWKTRRITFYKFCKVEASQVYYHNVHVLLLSYTEKTTSFRSLKLSVCQGLKLNVLLMWPFHLQLHIFTTRCPTILEIISGQ